MLSPTLFNEARVAYLDGDPVTLWEAQNLTTTYTRAGNVPFTIGQSRASDIYSRSFQFADTLSWSSGMHSLRIGASAARHQSGGTGSEPGTAILGTFTFKNTTTAPFGRSREPASCHCDTYRQSGGRSGVRTPRSEHSTGLVGDEQVVGNSDRSGSSGHPERRGEEAGTRVAAISHGRSAGCPSA